MSNNFLEIYDTVSDNARSLWDDLEAVASEIESAPQEVLDEVMRLTAAWGAEPSTAQGVILGAVFVTYLHRLGGRNAKAQTPIPRDLDRVVTLITHRCFVPDPNGKIAGSEIMSRVRALLVEDTRLAQLATEVGFSVAPNNRGYRLLKATLVDGATRITNASGKETLYGWRVKNPTK